MYCTALVMSFRCCHFRILPKPCLSQCSVLIRGNRFAIIVPSPMSDLSTPETQLMSVLDVATQSLLPIAPA